MTSYKDQIVSSMTMLGQDPQVVFVGYNVKYGRAGCTLKEVPEEKLQEMPLAENLMSGAAIGLSLDGNIPVLYFERFDFVLCALDAIVNHLNHIGNISEGIHKPAVIIRIVVGNKKVPLFTGPTHCQDFTTALRSMVSFPIVNLWHSPNVQEEYAKALERAKAGQSTALIEYKDQLQS